MDKLAIHGGTPVRETPIAYSRQYIDDADIAAVTQALRSDFLTCGPRLPALERRLEAVTGAAHAVAVANGTAALHAALYAAGVGPGDEVITTPMTFAASANAALYLGARPVFADIDPGHWNICPRAVERAVTPRTKAVVAVDYTGQAAPLEPLLDICRGRGLALVEDAAHSLGTRYNGQPVGSVADFTTFSFHPVKTVTCGEGGAVTVNDSAPAERLRGFRAHGVTRDKALLQGGDGAAWWYEQQDLGCNYRLTDIQAALLISQLDKLEAFAVRRNNIVSRYRKAFAQLPQVIPQGEVAGSESVYHLFVLRLDLESLTAGRRQVFDALFAENILCNVHYIPMYYHPYYQGLGYQRGLCPNAERLYEQILSLPLYPAMTDADVDDVILAVKKVLGHYAK